MSRGSWLMSDCELPTMEELLHECRQMANMRELASKNDSEDILKNKKADKENKLHQKKDSSLKVLKPDSKAKITGSSEVSKVTKYAKIDESFTSSAYGALELGSSVFAMNNFSGLYCPAKVVSRTSIGSECYNIILYTGEKKVCHRKYILTNRDPKFYSAKVEAIEEVNKVLDPELSSKDWERLITVIGQHKDVLKSIILGKTASLRDHMYLFDHLKRSSLFRMSRPSPFRQSEFAFLCKYLALDFIDDCQVDDPTFKDAVAARFASAGHSLNMSLPNYVLLVLAPELLIRVLLRQFKQLKTLEEAADFYLEHTFETETSYVALMYTSREMYRYTFSESKTKF